MYNESNSLTSRQKINPKQVDMPLKSIYQSLMNNDSNLFIYLIFLSLLQAIILF